MANFWNFRVARWPALLYYFVNSFWFWYKYSTVVPKNTYFKLRSCYIPPHPKKKNETPPKNEQTVQQRVVLDVEAYSMDTNATYLTLRNVRFGVRYMCIQLPGCPQFPLTTHGVQFWHAKCTQVSSHILLNMLLKCDERLLTLGWKVCRSGGHGDTHGDDTSWQGVTLLDRIPSQ